MTALLLALVLAATGIPRQVDPGLTAIAERRVIEVQAEWHHAGAHLAWSEEVLHFSQNAAANGLDPIALAIEAWRSSPGHWAVLADESLTRIGCAVAVTVDATVYSVCVLAPPALLPNTATAADRVGAGTIAADGRRARHPRR